MTDEQQAEGKVLPICLEEIKRCQPYFIGLLGERYGWVPDVIPQDLINREPWLKEHLDHSVTELEILHGVLNNPDMAEHAFFYFRDPQYLKKLPKNIDQADFISEDEASRTKLDDLKKRIRKSKFPFREDYADPKALAELVLQISPRSSINATPLMRKSIPWRRMPLNMRPMHKAGLRSTLEGRSIIKGLKSMSSPKISH